LQERISSKPFIMSFYKFILKSLWYFRKQHLAVLAGTIISTAVLTGALIIGDSVSNSLVKLVETRLGNVKFALQTGDRYVSQELSGKLAANLNINTAPVLSLKSIAINPENGQRINSVNIHGINSDFWKLSDIDALQLNNDEVAVSKNIAEKLNLNPGDEFLLRVQNADIIPLNAPFVSEERQSVAFRLRLAYISDDNNLGRFSLKSDQSAPYNVFINLEYLSNRLDLSGKVNIILADNNVNKNLALADFDKALSQEWELEDVGLSINEISNSSKFELVSERIFIEKQISERIINLQFHSETILTYLVNGISKEDKFCPYSFVTAAGPELLNTDLKSNEIIINKWLADDLDAKEGDTINLDYYIIGPLRTLAEKNENFVIVRVIPVIGNQDYMSLMPPFPGVSDAGSCRDWDTGIPIDLDKIRDKDEEYWNNYKGTPKAFVSESTGSDLWENQFGNFTAIRFENSNISTEKLEPQLLNKLKPIDVKLEFKAVYDRGQRAAGDSVDFGELFLSMSFFVIMAAVLLTVLIYSLNTESRNSETAVLGGLGFKTGLIIKIRLAESSFIALFGSIVGAGIGILYNYGLLAGLNTIWNDAVRTNMLEISIIPFTIIKGLVLGMLIALLTIFIVSIIKSRKTVKSLVEKSTENTLSKTDRNKKLSRIFLYCGIGGSLILVIYSIITSVENNAALFLTAGALFLFGTVALLNLYLLNIGNQFKFPGIQNLAVKNAARNKSRSLTTVILLAIGAFTIIITGANRKTFYGTEENRGSGTGGFNLWVETTIPILNDLNTYEGKSSFSMENEAVLANVNFVQLFSLDGDDASCHNLNQVQNPQILGVKPEIFDSLNAFSFVNLLNEYEKPWLELNNEYDANIIPAFADQTVIQWGLMKSLGDTLFYTNEKGQEIGLILVGGLNNSIFQGNILISQKAFLMNFPSSGGSKIMLIDSEKENQSELEEYLNNYLVDYGIEVQPASIRLAEFYSVENTYLAVIMFHGGLGVIIGTIGLGLVLLRTMLDRKYELGLLTALGFNKSSVFKLIMTEYIFLLITGLSCGGAAAIIGILPSLLSPSFDIPGSFMLLIILMVLVNGILWIYFPAKLALKKNLIEALRTE